MLQYGDGGGSGGGRKGRIGRMLALLPESITFLDLENVACKAHVLKFNGTQGGGRTRAHQSEVILKMESSSSSAERIFF